MSLLRFASLLGGIQDKHTACGDVQQNQKNQTLNAHNMQKMDKLASEIIHAC